MDAPEPEDLAETPDVGPVPEPAAARRADALTLLAALATATAPLTTDQLAEAMGWTLARIITAVEHAAATPALAGPLALRQVAASTYTLTPRLDLLTSDQRRQVQDASRWCQPLDVERANVLLAALVLHHGEYGGVPGPSYAEWREGHLDHERVLRVSGLLYADHKPEAVKINPGVLYSLRCQDSPHRDGQLPVQATGAIGRSASLPAATPTTDVSDNNLSSPLTKPVRGH